jgi:hypothetical protein
MFVRLSWLDSFVNLLEVGQIEYLRRTVLQEYFNYYNNDQTHLGIKKESPTGRQFTKQSSISDCLVGLPKVGGLHHRYEWRAAA